MANLSTPHPQIKKNLLLIRVVLGLVLATYIFFRFQAPRHDTPWLVGLLVFLAVSYIPFRLLNEEQWNKVFPQYLVFAMDLILILGILYFTDHMETEFLLSLFLTLFISALSRSIGNSVLVAVAVSGLYLYHAYLTKETIDFTDPFLMLSLSLLFMVAIEAGYLAFRVVEEEQKLVDMARRMSALNQQVKDGSQAALDYAGSLKNVLDSLPMGALAVSRVGEILFINQTLGKLLDLNTRSLVNLNVHNVKLGPFGERMAKSLKEKVFLKHEYMDLVWGGRSRRFRLDSSEGIVPGSGPWGTLFLIQEAMKPDEETSSNPPEINKEKP